MNNVAGLYIIGVPYRVDRIFDYYIPSAYLGMLEPGMIVTVPFGRSNKKRYAVVANVFSSDDTGNLKPITGIEEGYRLDRDSIGLCQFMKEQYFCSFGEAAKCMLPAALFSRIKEIYTPSKERPEGDMISAKALTVYSDILKNGSMSSDLLTGKYGEEVLALADSLVGLGYLEKITSSEKKNIVHEDIIHLSCDSDSAYRNLENKVIKGVKQISVYSHLIKHGSTAYSELASIYGVSKATIKTLEEKKLIEIERREVMRNPYAGKGKPPKDYELTEKQKEALGIINSLLDQPGSHAALLYGVTGSGKTAVIKKTIDRVIANGKKVIMLVPEIALTPQAVSVFCSYYGDRVALIHSSLSEGERFDSWRRICSGDADICIGTRSAIFAPFKDLGLIVIDEEHEHTYKSEMSPKYHARDIARYRAAHSGALMLLSSATPSLESFYKARKGKYTLIKLTERYNDRALPQTIINDMRVDTEAGNLDALGTLMRDAVKKISVRGEQAILFVNRRGYNNFVSCPLCGHVEKCERCSVSYTYHSYGKRDPKNGSLVCHYCGSRKPAPRVCPECGNDALLYNGFGTQKAEESLTELFPSLRVMRMDADTTGSKFSFDRMIESFRKGEADILIGTQMVSKGHDFPNVTLVGVLSADSMLYMDDFRANERSFSLLTQVVGRAGRAEKQGIAIIQTYNPDHTVIRYAAAQDYEAFYENEIALRKNYLFPPFCDIAVFTFGAPEESVFKTILPEFAKSLSGMLENEFRDVKMVVYGPVEAPLYKLNNMYRMRYIIKCKNNGRTRELLSKLYCEFSKKESSKLTVGIDINPTSL